MLGCGPNRMCDCDFLLNDRVWTKSALYVAFYVSYRRLTNSLIIVKSVSKTPRIGLYEASRYPRVGHSYRPRLPV
ncbi:hypothetical protein Hanom_Chr15g01384611 [Helianthus anomalus]